MDLLKMALIILSDSDAVIPNFLEQTHRTCVFVSWTQDFFKLKYVISGFTVDLRLVEPFGVYALICFSTKQFRKVRVVPGHSGFSETCFRSHNTK